MWKEGKVMEKWLTLHARVKTLLTATAVATVGQTILVLNGTENFGLAWHNTAIALAGCVLVYLAPSENK